MSRYMNQIKVSAPPESLMPSITEFLTREGFNTTQYKGQAVWKKGVGVLTAPQYIVITCGIDYIQVEGFIRFAILPGVYAGEMGTSGFIGAVPKSNLKGRINAIEKYILSLA